MRLSRVRAIAPVLALALAGCLAPGGTAPPDENPPVQITPTCFLASGAADDEDAQVALIGETYHVGDAAHAKAALVLVTTGAGQMHYWDGELPGLGRANDTTLPRLLARAGYAVFAYDRLGTGHSAYAGDDRAITLGTNARHVGEIITHVRAGTYAWGARDCAAPPGPPVANVALGGHSFGGMIAAEYAVGGGAMDAFLLMGYVSGGNPEFVAALLACTAGQLADDPAGEQFYPFCPGPDGYSEDCVRFTAYLPGTTRDHAEAFCKNEELHPEPSGTVSEFFQAGARGAPTRPIGDVPMLVVVGDHDCLTNLGPACDDRSQAERGLEQWRANCGCRFASAWIPEMGHDFVIHHTYLQHNEIVRDWMDASFS